MLQHFYSESFEEKVIGKNINTVKGLFTDSILEKQSDEECVFILKSKFFGLFKKRIYFFLHKGKVRDYHIG